MKKQWEDMKVVKLLSELPKEYQSIKDQILGVVSIPSVIEVYERLQRISLTNEPDNTLVNAFDKTTLATTSTYYGLRGGRGSHIGHGGSSGRFLGEVEVVVVVEETMCTHCDLTNHTVEFCWNLHGNSQGLIKHLCLRMLLQMIDPLLLLHLIPVVIRLVLQYHGKNMCGFSHLVALHSHSWIIISGASDLIFGCCNSFSPFNCISSNMSVKLADGTSSTIVGLGIAQPNWSMSLSSVLYATKFPFSLLSVSKLTKSLNFSISFFDSNCVFQDLEASGMIGEGHERNGLYNLKRESVGEAMLPKGNSVVSSFGSSISPETTISSVLSFPKVSNLECEAC